MNRRTLIAATVATIITGGTTPAAHAGWIEDIVRDRARYWGVDEDWLWQVCLCESGGNPSAQSSDINIDGSGYDSGLMQFSPETFAEMCGYMGITGDLWNPWDSAHVAAWAFANGYACRWVCACPWAFE